MRGMIRSNYIHFGCGNPSAGHLANLETRANIQRSRRLFKAGKGNPGVNQCAQQHVAANAGKAFQISNTHRERF
jgi:hypothetical protein